ncbi:MAG: hypothetical protein WAM39_04235 [Bryobacteraceae bacterium]
MAETVAKKRDGAICGTGGEGGSAELISALELVLSGGERLRIGKGVDAATLRLVLDVIRA